MANARKLYTVKTNFKHVNELSLLLIEGHYCWKGSSVVTPFSDPNDMLDLYEDPTNRSCYNVSKQLGDDCWLNAVMDRKDYNIVGTLLVSIEVFSENWKGPNAVYQSGNSVPYKCVFSTPKCLGKNNVVASERDWFRCIDKLTEIRENKGLLNTLSSDKRECVDIVRYLTMTI